MGQTLKSHMTDNLPPLINALHNPNVYDHPVHEMKLVQTHISFVLLAGEYVYKIKKPLNLGFLNFSTLKQRHHFCEEELRLNRRLCPTIYLDVKPIFFDGKLYNLHGKGKIVEYCLKMSRMPEDKMMNKIIGRGQLTKESIDLIIEVLEPFYDQAAGGPEISQNGISEAVGQIVLENLRQTEKFVGCKALSQEEYESINKYTNQFLQNNELFDKRIQDGKIKDCHGDLHSANICLANQTYIYDCIEFNNRYRYSDIAADLAFLAMDLDFHNLNTLSDHLVNRYIADSGDEEILTVLHFYKCYRATVRGKIGLLTAHEPEVDEQTKSSAFEQATRYFLLAQQYANE